MGMTTATAFLPGTRSEKMFNAASATQALSFGPSPPFAGFTSTFFRIGLTPPAIRPSWASNSANRSMAPFPADRSAFFSRKFPTSRSASPSTDARPEKPSFFASGSAVTKTETCPVFCKVPLAASVVGSPFKRPTRVAKFSSVPSRSCNQRDGAPLLVSSANATSARFSSIRSTSSGERRLSFSPSSGSSGFVWLPSFDGARMRLSLGPSSSTFPTSSCLWIRSRQCRPSSMRRA